MNELSEIQELLKEIAAHLQSGSKTERKKAVVKLQRISALADTLSLVLRTQR